VLYVERRDVAAWWIIKAYCPPNHKGRRVPYIVVWLLILARKPRHTYPIREAYAVDYK
jgi:hypothetical protein